MKDSLITQIIGDCYLCVSARRAARLPDTLMVYICMQELG